MRIRTWTWLALALVLLPAAAEAQLTAGVTPSRTSGTAPLYVFFDGTTDAGTNHSDGDLVEFRDLLCEWNFDDSDSGTWTNTGASKNEATGCIAAHVYETAGTYNPTLRIRDEAGNEQTVSRTITVTAADATWSGSQTVCVSTSGNFAGCPSGASQVVSSDYDQVLANQCDVNSNNARRRCLFRRGERFTINAGTQLWNGPMMIGAFGTGARPIIDGSSMGDSPMHTLGRYTPAENATDIRITGLEFIGGSGYQGNSHSIVTCGSAGSVGVEDVLLMDLVTRDVGTTIACADSGNPRDTPDKLAFVDLTVHSPDHRSVGFLSSTRTAIMGVRSDATGARSSHARISFGRKMVVQHNELTGRTGNTSFKLAGYAARAAGPQVPDVRQQRFWLLSDNRIDCDGGNCIGGYNDAGEGGVSVLDHAVIERNDFRIAQGHHGRVAESCFARSAWRNNVSRAGTDSANPFLTMRDSAGDCTYSLSGIRILNNTFYGTGDRPRHAIDVTSANTDMIIRNNLYYSPGDTDTNRILSGSPGSGSSVSNNLQTNDDVFANVGAFDEGRDFRLNASAAGSGQVIDAGFDVFSSINDGEVVFKDFEGKCLTSSNSASRRDLGAFESGGITCSAMIPGGGGGGGGGGGNALAAPDFLQ